MDEEEIIEYIPVVSRKHDRWSLLVLTGNFVTQVLNETAKFADTLTEVAFQHRNHLVEESKFFEITKDL
jgi:hypothetical protein